LAASAGGRPREQRFRRTFHEARRRPLGIETLALIGGLGAVTLILAIVMFAAGSWVAGIVLLVITGALLWAFLAAARRHPEAPAASGALAAADRVGSLLRLVIVGGAVSARAGLRLVGVRRRRYQLRHQLHAQLQPLGEAVYQGDDQRARAIKAQARRLEHALAQTERASADLLSGIRRELADERAAVEATTPLPRERVVGAGEFQPPRERVRT
jgi:hypothetical protein